ncbi:MAG: IS30 family transposase [Bacteroides sp.]|nr:IS30 family transposase [Bacteroides sp.]
MKKESTRKTSRKNTKKKPREHFTHLTFNERLKIEAWDRAKVPVKEMAEMLGKDQSSIYRELHRGKYTRLNGDDYTFHNAYSPDIAEEKYRENLKAKGAALKIGNDVEYANYIEDKIVNEKYSPKAVLGEIERKDLRFETKISYTTLYRYIDDGLFLRLSNKDLPVKRNKKKKKYNHVEQVRPSKGDSIEKRPEEIDSRETFGHWEMDCVVGTKTTPKVLLVLTERKTRREIVRLMPSKTTDSVVNELNKLEKKVGSELFKKVFCSITVDNGSEFMDNKGMELSENGERRTKVYYCHPYSSYERGSNENLNKMVRRWYPKGEDFMMTTEEEIAALEEWMNEYPREIFEYDTAASRFDEEMMKLTG